MTTAPATPDRKRPVLHLIGNAHIDSVWLWPWQEGFQEVRATFRSALDRMAETDGFIFTASSAAMYAWVEEVDPAMFAEIQQRVAEGRWHITGGWWIQPDCNLPAGESFVRQALVGQRYFREKFGVTATVGYNVDSFGHHGMLPQLLAKSGLESYVFMRPEPHEKELPSRLFWWEADDGSRVLAYRLPFTYCPGPNTIAGHIERCAAELRPPAPEGLVFYGVGNHGGGPTREMLAFLTSRMEDRSGPELRFSTPEAFFTDMRAAEQASGLVITVVHEELQHHASGCYAAHSGVKRWNRQAELALLGAERWSTLAHRIRNVPYPADALNRGWRQVLFNQFHDILAGTSIKEAYEDARDSFGEAKAMAGWHQNIALQSIAGEVDIPHVERTFPLLVFNPHPWPLRTGVELETGALPEAYALLDAASGEAVPVQEIQPQATVGARSRNRIAFTADLQPLGFHLYRLAPSPASSVVQSSSLRTTGTTIENRHLRLALDTETGEPVELVVKATGTNLLDGPVRAVVIDDPSDTWSHGVLRFDQEIGAFTASRVELVETGPVRAVLRVWSTHESSRLIQEYVLWEDERQVEVRLTLDWHEHHKLLKLRYPLRLDPVTTTATYEIPYGTIVRPANGEEEPGQTWLDVSGRTADGTPAGLSLLNDSTYSYSTLPDELSVTIVRSPIYAHHDPAVPDPDMHYDYLDQGVTERTLALLPHHGDWREAATVRRAAALNARPVVRFEHAHPGPLPASGSFVSVESPGDRVMLGALKRAEDGDGTIVRLVETTGQPSRATVRLPIWDRIIDMSLGANEIKTLLVPDDPVAVVRELDLIERG